MTRIVRLADGYDTLADVTAIEDWASLLAFALAQPDADTAVHQMHRVAWQIIDHARAIKIREEARVALLERDSNIVRPQPPRAGVTKCA
ncbi:hypothetical protein [Bradyrhizobium elkanii]|uniref:hypothetical protein n=1 Tax=Bradyrhizobium elkanii TaxID=29448 RepID=UPI00209E32B7|nr:hypothetical protein [Bradyrhizobium elkanii]MCP1931781.1 hypothetical protein [Bradyrhizobium elkanii]